MKQNSTSGLFSGCIILSSMIFSAACCGGPPQESSDIARPSGGESQSMGKDPFSGKREAMVKGQIEARGVRDPSTLAAMRTVPRHEFVPPRSRHLAYEDYPLPIGLDQTISQPYIVAFMTEALMIGPGDRGFDFLGYVLTPAGLEASIILF